MSEVRHPGFGWDDDDLVTQQIELPDDAGADVDVDVDVDVDAGVDLADEQTRVVDVSSLRANTETPLSADELLKSRLASGARVGRFVVQRQLDEGGMGLIFRAHDEELDRAVALKILRAQQSEGSIGRARLIREAQALAKLSHPNVVTVYEVGEWQGNVFVAMELVEGRTLRGWLKLKRWRWREVVSMFVQAGRGVAAAHSAGIIHRDFKPSNALVGHDGRVRVLDFGLALAAESTIADRIAANPANPANPAVPENGDSVSSLVTGSTSSSLLGASLTVAGAVAGTPPYMAPEQLLGVEIDARADQYAFCVALYEGLYRRRPFRGKTVSERRRELADGVALSFPSKIRVPAWIRKALRRGLATDPEDRYPTMGALVSALAEDPTRRRRWALGGTVAASLLLGGGYLIAKQQAAPVDPCLEFGDELAAVWNDERREAVAEAVRGTGMGYAEATWERLQPRLDAYAESWSERRVDACRTHQSGAHDAELYGLEVSCLDHRRMALKALTATLAEADAEVLRRAIQAAESLPAIATCEDIGALTSAAPPPEDPEVAAEVERLREVLEAARVELGLRRHAKGLSLSQEVVERSRELEYSPLEAEALMIHGNLLDIAGEYEAAEAALHRGVWRADVVRDDPLLARTMSSLIYVISEGRGDYVRAQSWRPHADAVIERLGDGTRGEARLLSTFGQLAMRQDEDEAALRLSERSLEIVEELYGPDDRELTGSLMALSNAYIGGGKFSEAQALLERALKINEEQLGPEHPALSSILNNLGSVHGMAGDVDGTLPFFERALKIEEAVMGPDHPSLAHPLGNIGATYAFQGKRKEALVYMERALAVEEKARGADHPTVAVTLHNLGSINAEEGNHDAAYGYLERALKIRQAKLPPDALMTTVVMSDLGNLCLEIGKARQGLRHLEKAYARSKGSEEGAKTHAVAAFRLAKFYRESASRKQRARARDLTAEALRYYTEAGVEQHAEMIAQLEGWLAELGPAKKSRGKKSKRAKKKKKGKKK